MNTHTHTYNHIGRDGWWFLVFTLSDIDFKIILKMQQTDFLSFFRLTLFAVCLVSKWSTGCFACFSTFDWTPKCSFSRVDFTGMNELLNTLSIHIRKATRMVNADLLTFTTLFRSSSFPDSGDIRDEKTKNRLILRTIRNSEQNVDRRKVALTKATYSRQLRDSLSYLEEPEDLKSWKDWTFASNNGILFIDCLIWNEDLETNANPVWSYVN